MSDHPGRSYGLHHVTAIATDPRRNREFYVDLLGLRLVKRTVNFDDPGTYHLYYGDRIGSPGTILTFFPWPRARRGSLGAGMTHTTAFAVPETSLGWWQERLRSNSVVMGEVEERFAEAALPFLDPDGMRLELVATAEPIETTETWREGPVDPSRAIRGFHSVTLLERDVDPTAGVLTGLLGYTPTAEIGGRHRFSAPGGAPGRYVDLLIENTGAGSVAAGTVHHVAFRAADDAQQASIHRQVQASGTGVSPVMDRQYFRSIYFREPGGVLFEVATDPPGFTRDESVEQLGTSLKLPEWYEADRDRIEAALPDLGSPGRVHEPRPATGDPR